MTSLLAKVKANLILEHSEDDELLERFILTALSYAESYQHLTEGYYSENEIPATTEQAIIMLASSQVWNTVNLLLRLDRRWQV